MEFDTTPGVFTNDSVAGSSESQALAPAKQRDHKKQSSERKNIKRVKSVSRLTFGRSCPKNMGQFGLAANLGSHRNQNERNVRSQKK